MTNPAILWSYEFDAQPVLRIDVNGSGAEDITLGTAANTAYYMSGDGSSSDLLKLLEDAVEDHTVGATATVSLTAGREVQVAVSGLGLNVQLLWSHANTTLDATIYGWTSAADSSTAVTISSPNEAAGLWLPGKPPESDTGDVQNVIGGQTVSLSGQVRTSVFAKPRAVREMFFGLLLQEKAETQYATATEPLASYEAAWLASLAYGYPLRYCPDEATLTTYTEYVLQGPSARTVGRDERFPAQRYQVELRLRRTA